MYLYVCVSVTAVSAHFNVYMHMFLKSYYRADTSSNRVCVCAEPTVGGEAA